jgi:hypothetical protein
MTAEVSKGPVARPVSDEARDDAVVPFAVEPLDVRGRVVRLGESIDHILANITTQRRWRGLSAKPAC